jgi:hypothetical protein
MFDNPLDHLCDDCSKPVPFEFKVDHRSWNKVIHHIDTSMCDEMWSDTSKYLCLNCFVIRATDLEVTEFHLSWITPLEYGGKI